MAEIPPDVKAKAAALMADTKSAVQALPADATPANAAPMRSGAVEAQQNIAKMAQNGQDATAITNAASQDNFRKP